MSSTQEVGNIFDEGSGPQHAMLRSPTVLIASIGLWGMNIFFFRFFHIDYVRILKYDLMDEDEKRMSILQRRKAAMEMSSTSSSTTKKATATAAKSKTTKTTAAAATTTTTTSTITNANVTAATVVASTTIPTETKMKVPTPTTIIPTATTTTSNGCKERTIERRESGTSSLWATSDDDHHHEHLLVDHSASHNDDDHHHDVVLRRSNSRGSSRSSRSNSPSAVSYTAGGGGVGGGVGVDGGGVGNDNITWSRLVVLSIVLMFILHFTTRIWMDDMGGNFIGAVLTYYISVTVFILLPLPMTQWLRKAAVIALQRAFELVNPRCYCLSASSDGIRPVPFVDVFYADAMCSLSKVFFDWGMLTHMLSHYPKPVPQAVHNILIPSACAAVPFLIRARQCIVMHTVGKIKNDPKRYEHLLNALKYSTSIFPICLSAYQKTIGPDQASRLDNYLILLLTINALYAFYWDVVMDWGMMHNPTAAVGTVCVGATGGFGVASVASVGGAGVGVNTIGTNVNMGISSAPSEEKKLHAPPPIAIRGRPHFCHILLRPKLRFGALLSSIILITDAILRFSWTLRFFSGSLFPSDDYFVLCTQFLEVFRRAIWNLLRVEWENLKQMKAAIKSEKSEHPDNHMDYDEEMDNHVKYHSLHHTKHEDKTMGTCWDNLKQTNAAAVKRVKNEYHSNNEDELAEFIS